jgi:hypothetical protein
MLKQQQGNTKNTDHLIACQDLAIYNNSSKCKKNTPDYLISTLAVLTLDN